MNGLFHKIDFACHFTERFCKFQWHILEHKPQQLFQILSLLRLPRGLYVRVCQEPSSGVPTTSRTVDCNILSSSIPVSDWL